ncbi:MAG: hypothetical protein HQK49_22770 [Oligoflexia bacterium]|nr:hypothetical protein [Oligoflexia bacterium]
MKGDFRPLEVVWEKYGSGEDDDDDGDENCEREFPCSLKKTKDGASVAKKLKSILGDP